MFRRVLNLAALLSLAIIIALLAGGLWAYRAGGAVEVAHVADWHVWIDHGALVLAPFGPESDALQPVTACVPLHWLIAPFVAYAVGWAVLAVRRSRRRRHRRGFPVEPSSRY